MTAPGRSAGPRWRRFVAVGDSFTEGVGDPHPDGSVRGWADLVAGALADETPELRYANLAIRGRRFDRVLAEQVPVAAAMRPDLVSFAAGGNDALRPGFSLDRIMDRFEDTVGTLRASGADVILFRFPDMSLRLPLKRVLRKRIVAMNDAVAEIGTRHRAYLVDMYADEGLTHPAAWSDDRLHLSTLGHRRVASHILSALGLPADRSWLTLPPTPPATGWLRARHIDLDWAHAHLAPWVHRRLTGRSSGQARIPKRPELAPVDTSAT